MQRTLSHLLGEQQEFYVKTGGDLHASTGSNPAAVLVGERWTERESPRDGELPQGLWYKDHRKEALPAEMHPKGKGGTLPDVFQGWLGAWPVATEE